MPKDADYMAADAAQPQRADRNAGALARFCHVAAGSQPPELDQSVDDFLTDLKRLEWRPESRMEALNGAICAIDRWAARQIAFYSRRSRNLQMISCGLRFVGWLLATVGVLIPLLGATDMEMDARYGFVLLALAGAVFGLDRLLGFTGSNVRVTHARIALERLVVTTHGEWCNIRLFAVDATNCEDSFKKGVALVLGYGQALYDTISQERAQWGAETIRELQRFVLRLEKAPEPQSEPRASDAPPRAAHLA